MQPHGLFRVDELMTREVHWKDEREEQIIRQLVAWRHREILETDG